jgi:NADP-dependent 3-hydroxy acid dehydrogenase YdfG
LTADGTGQSDIHCRRNKVLEITNAVAVISGGASGIGLTLARFWVENGGYVVLGDVSVSALEQVQEEFGDKAATVECDVTKEKDSGRLAGLPKRPWLPLGK